MMGHKLGIHTMTEADHPLVQQLLTHMQGSGWITPTPSSCWPSDGYFRGGHFAGERFAGMVTRWRQRVQDQTGGKATGLGPMATANPW